MFALNLTPCADDGASHGDANTQISQGTPNDHQHQDFDLCSPFCICQCCHINATYVKSDDYKLGFALIPSQDFLYLSGIENDYPTSILQPPIA